jgi:NAD(P)-dependent dehydrogenase (short-subunit alcohol dehydrogenase family)
VENNFAFTEQIKNDRLKTAIVTGATGAIGKAIAKRIADKGNYLVILAARDLTKAVELVRDVRNTSANRHVYYTLVDLSVKSEIERFAASVLMPVEALVNNAACTPIKREETQQGIEKQWATNVLGYFWMMQAFKSHLKAAKEPRIVNVASYWAGGLDMRDPEFRQRHYDNNSAYRQSKQADRMLSTAFAGKFKSIGIAVNACHPGEVNSRLSNELGFGGHESPDKGAETPVWLATTKMGVNHTGGYFEYLRERPCMFSRDASAVRDLYSLCQSY